MTLEAWKVERALLILGVMCSASACTVSERGVESPRGHSDVVRVEGTVSRVDELPSPEEHLRQVAVVTLHASGAPVRVELAPGWFLEQHGLLYTPEQQLSVVGERVAGDDARVIAREVQQGDVRVRLRDEQGRPVWQHATPVPPSEGQR